MTTTDEEHPFVEQTAAESKEQKQDEKGENAVKENEDGKPDEQNLSGHALSEQAKADSVDSDDTAPATTDASPAPSSTPWQAIFAPQYNAYYFYNTETQQTTWENPLLTPASTSQTPDPTSTGNEGSSSDAYTNPHAALEAAAMAAGIDPALAHLDPTLLSSIPSSSTAPTSAGLPPAFTAKFNARTGQFARPDARDPTHLSEHARAMRMSEFYFDVSAWENQLAQQGGSIKGGGEEEGKKRKRPTKTDLERFKEQKKQKKLAKTAWLRT